MVGILSTIKFKFKKQVQVHFMHSQRKRLNLNLTLGLELSKTLTESSQDNGQKLACHHIAVGILGMIKF